MRSFKTFSFLFSWIAFASLLFSCSDNSSPEPLPEVKISVDKPSIKANGLDSAIFTVTVNGVATTTSVSIIQKEDSLPTNGFSFSSNQTGSFTFYATYEGQKSNEVTIQATELAVTFSVDKNAIKANGKDAVTFTVKLDDQDVTASSEIFYQSQGDSVIQNHSFSTLVPGDHAFYAMVNGQKSDLITVHASAIELLLSVDKSSILANNSDKAIFKVTADGEDITSLTEIIQKGNPELKIKDASFFTDESSTYRFYATFNGNTISNEVTVEATYVELAFLKGYAIMQIASTICPNCPLMTNAIQDVKNSLPGRIHNIALHPYGKYCNSGLAGALASTAVQFADHVEADASLTPPLAIIDIVKPEYLSATTTPKRIVKSIDESTIRRGRISETGIAIQSQVKGDVIHFDVKVKTVHTNNYHFFAFVVEDRIIRNQLMPDRTTDENYVHNDVATYMLQQGDPFNGVDLGMIVKGKSISKSFSIDTKGFDTKRNVNLSNCRIVAYTLRDMGGTYYIDNVTSCPVDGSVSFKYE